MAETEAEWARTPHHDDSSDTDVAAQDSVFAAVGPSEPDPSAGSAPAPDTPKSSAGANVGESTDSTKGSQGLRSWLEQHPLAAAAIAVGAIGVGVIGYRWVRHSLPVRLYLALRFGRFREIIRA